MKRVLSLYEQIGGEATVAAVVEEFYLRVLANPKLAAYFAHASVDDIKEHQRAFLTMLLHGPARYTGRSMHEAHAGYRITAADFDRIVQHLEASLEAAHVSAELAGEIVARVAPLRTEIVEC